MSEPSQQDIDRLKAAHPNKSLHRLDIKVADEDLVLVMTGPGKAEYEKFNLEISAAQEKKGDAEKGKALRDAVERAALAQIRWPDRQATVDLFERFPALALNLGEKLHDLAGATVEVVAKKL